MYYRVHLDVPANTLITTPVTADIPAVRGVVYRVSLQFPPGCAGLVHVNLWHVEQQLWPSNMGEFFAADGYTIEFQEEYQLVEVPYVLRLEGYSDDDTYPHRVSARIGVRRLEAGRLPAWMYRLVGRTWEGQY